MIVIVIFSYGGHDLLSLRESGRKGAVLPAGPIYILLRKAKRDYSNVNRVLRFRHFINCYISLNRADLCSDNTVLLSPKSLLFCCLLLF